MSQLLRGFRPMRSGWCALFARKFAPPAAQKLRQMASYHVSRMAVWEAAHPELKAAPVVSTWISLLSAPDETRQDKTRRQLFQPARLIQLSSIWGNVHRQHVLTLPEQLRKHGHVALPHETHCCVLPMLWPAQGSP